MSSILKVNTIQDTDGNNIINENANTITIGASGDTITIPSGATITNNGTQTGFGRTGTVDWQSTVKTATFTASDGEGYFCNTTAGSFTVNLPAGSAGAIVAVKDYANTFDNNALTITPNGSDKIGGSAASASISTEGIAVTLVFIDSTKGWLVTDSGLQSEAETTYSADMLVIAGGGGGGANGGGGGAGGYRTSTQDVSISAVYTITVGDGGAKGQTFSANPGSVGADSSISGSGLTTITSAGGGFGGGNDGDGGDGGSGGGGGNTGSTKTGGSGNTPSVSPSQGNDGGSSVGSTYGGGGGGGATGTGGNKASGTSVAGNGGSGASSSITGSAVTRAGGGGGGINNTSTAGSGGSGGGGAGATSSSGNATPGTANTGGGGGGGSEGGTTTGGDGGKGVVILSVPTAKYSGTTTGSPTVTTSGSNTIMQFNGSGSYTA
jgi:hypothetical protein